MSDSTFNTCFIIARQAVLNHINDVYELKPKLNIYYCFCVNDFITFEYYALKIL